MLSVRRVGFLSGGLVVDVKRAEKVCWIEERRVETMRAVSTVSDGALFDEERRASCSPTALDVSLMRRTEVSTRSSHNSSSKARSASRTSP